MDLEQGTSKIREVIQDHFLTEAELGKRLVLNPLDSVLAWNTRNLGKPVAPE